MTELPADGGTALIERHLRVGWVALLVFAALGLGLETLHGFKVAAYVGVSNETRRLMWTLAHAHGTVLALVNLGFAFTVQHVGREWRQQGLASRCLLAASALIPSGFFLGGCFVYDGDPGLGILLVPVGGLSLLVAVALVVGAVRGSRRQGGRVVRIHQQRSRR